MTSYQGGKQRLGKQIYQAICAIENDLIGERLPYLEPFCGYCGVLKHFAQDEGRMCYATDANPDIVEMWRALQQGWIPDKECSKERYEELKVQTTPSAERGFYGVVCSFGGQYFEGTYRTRTKQHDFIAAGIRGVSHAAKIMYGVSFLEPTSYDKLKPEHHLIYCDPPYKDNMLKNEFFRGFDHDRFWDIVRKWSATNIVIVSERIAPDDFVAFWSRPYSVTYVKKNGNQARRYTEKLFIHESRLHKSNPDVQ